MEASALAGPPFDMWVLGIRRGNHVEKKIAPSHPQEFSLGGRLGVV